MEEHGGGSLTRDSEGKMNFQGMGCRRFCRWVYLFIRVVLGNLGRGSIYKELRERVEGGLWKWSISLYGSSVRATWGCKRRLWKWSPLSMRTSLGNLEEGPYARGLCVEAGSGAPVGNLGTRGPSLGNYEN
jgi:hypothetical protein